MMILNTTKDKKKNSIIFVHGNSSNSESWNGQITDKNLSERFSLYTLDLPGHGPQGSSSDYSIFNIASDLRREIAQEHLDGFVLVGHSLGTCIIGEMGRGMVNCKGFVLVSPNITSNEYHPGTYTIPFPELPAIVSENIEDEMLRSFAERLFFDKGSKYIEEYVRSFKMTDGKFRSQLGATISMGGWSDEPENIRSYGKEVAVVFGRYEEILNTQYLDNYGCLWNGKVDYIENSAHFPQLENSDDFNGLLMTYCNEAFG